VVEEGGQNGAVALAFERVFRRGLQQRPGLAIAQRRRLALVVVGLGAFDAADGVVADRINLAEMVEERGDRGQLAPDGAGGQAAPFEVFSPSNQVGAGHGAHFFGALDAGEGREFFHIDPVSAPGAGVIQVRKPFHLGRHVPQPLELGAA
jgi:hypothetical protein